MPAATGTQNGNFEDISILNWPLQGLLMGVEIPIPPKMIPAAAPEGAPPRRIKTVETIICRFSCFGCELPFMCVSTEKKKEKNPDGHPYQIAGGEGILLRFRSNQNYPFIR